MNTKCENCKYWEKDRGIWCVNGWSGQGKKDGFCHLEIEKIYKNGEDFCSHYEQKI